MPRIARATLAPLMVLAAIGCHSRPTPAAPLHATKLAKNVYLIEEPLGNVVASVGDHGVLLVGTQSSALTPQLRATVATLTTAPVRFVLFAPADSASEDGDAGWTAAGATVVAHESMRKQLGRAEPALGFSQVLQFYLDGESMHAVHQPPGHTRADFIVHFENAGVLWLGNAFLPRAYPEIDVARGGSIDSLITEVGGFTDFGDTKIVPGRGPVSTSKDVAAYRDMLVAVRDRVRALSATGQTMAQIIAAKPTAAYDARYGNGDRFVEQVYRSLNR
jgi:hypothetical protein